MFIALIVVVCFLLILIIMVQNPKGGGLSSSFGGGQQMGGVQKTTDFLDRSTWVLGGILLGLILLSNVALDRPQATTVSPARMAAPSGGSMRAAASAFFVAMRRA